MNKQEVIQKINDSMFSSRIIPLTYQSECFNQGMDTALKIISKLDEPQKVKVPVYVAEWISKCQELNWNLSALLAPEIFDSTFAFNTKEWLRQDKQNYDILARAWLDGYEVEEFKWAVNEGDLVIRRGCHEAKVYFVESIDDDGILLVNGIKDEFFTDEPERAADEETLSYFYGNFRLLAKKENLEVEKVGE